MPQPESKLSRDIMDALRARGIWCFKVHGGPMTMAGVPDIIACVPVPDESPIGSDTPVGLFVAFETKMPGREPSRVQAKRHEDIRAAGGYVYVPHSVADALRWLDAKGFIPPVD